MRIIAARTLKMYGRREKEAEQSLFAWYEEACLAEWKSHQDLKTQFGNASVLGGKRVVFNIHGNRYRLIVDIEYRLQIIFIVWIGMHAEYNMIDSKKIKYVKAD